MLSVLNDAVRWLHDHGIDQWGEDMWRGRSWFEQPLANGDTYLVRRKGAIVATNSLQWSDEAIWGADSTTDAGYVHRLAVSRPAHGSGLGRALLEWAAEQTRAKGRRFLRLDRPCENPALRSYYEAQGFEGRGERTFSGTWGSYCAALYEKSLASG